VKSSEREPGETFAALVMIASHPVLWTAAAVTPPFSTAAQQLNWHEHAGHGRAERQEHVQIQQHSSHGYFLDR
jgi:hypothetical protein